MYTKQAIREIGIRNQLSAEQLESLDTNGYFIVEDVLTEQQCDLMAAEFDRLATLENDHGGHEVHIEPTAQRISNIYNKSSLLTHAWKSPAAIGKPPSSGEIQASRGQP